MILSWQNWLDEPGVSIAASSAAGALTPDRLADPILLRRWRSRGIFEVLDVDLGEEREVGVVALAQPHDAGGVDARGRARGWLRPADQVRHFLDPAPGGLVNRLLWSEALDRAPWGVSIGAAVVPDVGFAPQGLPGADRVSLPPGGEVLQGVPGIPADTSPWHFSIWLRPVSAATVLLRLRFGADFTRFADLRATLATRTVAEMPGRPVAMIPGSIVSEDWGEWWRVGFAIPNAGRTIALAGLVGEGAGGAVDPWGAQLVSAVAPQGYRRTEGAPAGDGPGVGRGWDSRRFQAGWQPGYGVHVATPPAPVWARYWRADVWGQGLPADAAFIDLGRAWIGPAWRPSRHGQPIGGVNADWRWEFRDGSEITRNSRSGVEFVDAGPRQRAASFGVQVTSEEDAVALRELHRVAGAGGQVLFVPRASAGAAAIGQEAMIGRLEKLDPIAQPFFRVFDAAFTVRATL